MTDGILDGVRILEWGEFVSGPWTSRLLADMGADVIKIEQPGVGDSSRRAGPFPGDVPDDEKSGLFLYLNWNKRSVTLDLHHPESRNIFDKLVAQSDVLIENHPPSQTRDLGISYESLKKINPGLLMVSLSPFGQTGPYSDYAASELILFHAGGIGYETPIGEVTDRERQQPLKGPGYQSYFMAGWIAALSTMVGLFHKQTNGVGQYIDISEQEAIASTQRPNITRYSYAGEVYHREAMGGARFKQCKDGYFAGFGALGNDSMWQKLCAVIGNPEWTKKKIYENQASRREHASEIDPKIAEWMMRYTKAELFEMGQQGGLSCFPVNTVEDVYATEQYQYRGFFQEVAHPVAGTYAYPGIPFHFSSHQPGIRTRAPLLGEHTVIFLGELGFSDQEIVELRTKGII
jgi:crotonobetainyl-CoA:carnitine CoA-transferase CaiB-like acyl-CoA transferase